jgi:hypothetical protein
VLLGRTTRRVPRLPINFEDSGPTGVEDDEIDLSTDATFSANPVADNGVGHEADTCTLQRFGNADLGSGAEAHLLPDVRGLGAIESGTLVAPFSLRAWLDVEVIELAKRFLHNAAKATFALRGLVVQLARDRQHGAHERIGIRPLLSHERQHLIAFAPDAEVAVFEEGSKARFIFNFEISDRPAEGRRGSLSFHAGQG